MEKSEKVATLNAKEKLGKSKAADAVKEKTQDLVREKAKEAKPKEEQKPEKPKRVNMYRNVDYSASPEKQKNQRNKVREGLFKIITPYLAQKRAGTLKKEAAHKSFEQFKEYAKNEYYLPISQAEDFFRGSEEGQNALKDYVADLNKYLAREQK
jgi:hypothetical protein